MSDKVRQHLNVFGAAIACPLLAAGFRQLLAPLVHDELVFVTFIPAVFVCAIIGGFRPTILCTALCVLLASSLFMQPHGHLMPQASEDWGALLVFVFISVAAAVFGEHMLRKTEAIAKERERFRVTLASIADAVIVTNEHGNVSFMNDIAQTLTKVPFQQAEHKPLQDILKLIDSSHPSSAQFKHESSDTVCLTPRICTLVAADGSSVAIEKSSAAIRLQDGSSIGNVCVFRDVTHRLRAEDSLRDSEERLRLALDAGKTGTWEWNLLTNKVSWSPTLEQIHGISTGSFEGTFEAYQRDIHPEDRERVMASVQSTVATQGDHHLEYRIITPDGSTRWVEAKGRLYCNEEGQPMRMVGACSDITERKRAERSRHFMVEASKVLSALIDYQTALHEFTWMSVPEFAAWCCVDLVQPDNSLERVAVSHRDVDRSKSKLPTKPRLVAEGSVCWGGQTNSSSGAVLHQEVTDELLRTVACNEEEYKSLTQLQLVSYMHVPLTINQRMVGLLRFASSQVSHRYDDDDLAMARNLADRAAVAIENAKLYEELQQADRRKDEFLAMLAHELRNPLVPIRSGLDLLRMDNQSDQLIVRLMQEQVDHVVRLVDDLLDVSRIMRGRVELRCEQVELTPLITRAVDAVEPLLRSCSHQIQIKVPSHPLYLRVDPVRIVQVLTNLLNNAAKYMDAGGKIELTVKPDGDMVEIHVQDYGVGIDRDLLPHVFELFTQASRSLDRSQGGLGIGLTLVHTLVIMHGGSVQVQSDGPGTGSTFSVRLPLCEAPLKPRIPEDTTIAMEPAKVLVVDDNRSATTLIAKLLKKLGVSDVLTANDGSAAFEMILQHHPAIVLLDIGLPGMDGYEVARRVRDRQDLADVLLVALTGYGQEEDRKQSKEVGFDEHLTKPPSMDQIKAILCHPKRLVPT